MIEWLTKKQKELEKKYWCEHKLNENWKIYIVSTPEYEVYVKEQELEIINKEFLSEMSEVKNWYTIEEMIGWIFQITEAAKVIADNEYNSDLLSRIVITWETQLDLAHSILGNWEVGKKESFLQQYWTALGHKRQKVKDKWL